MRPCLLIGGVHGCMPCHQRSEHLCILPSVSQVICSHRGADGDAGQRHGRVRVGDAGLEAAHPAHFRGWVGFSIPVAHRIVAGADRSDVL